MLTHRLQIDCYTSKVWSNIENSASLERQKWFNDLIFKQREAYPATDYLKVFSTTVISIIYSLKQIVHRAKRKYMKRIKTRVVALWNMSQATPSSFIKKDRFIVRRFHQEKTMWHLKKTWYEQRRRDTMHNDEKKWFQNYF